MIPSFHRIFIESLCEGEQEEKKRDKDVGDSCSEVAYRKCEEGGGAGEEGYEVLSV